MGKESKNNVWLADADKGIVKHLERVERADGCYSFLTLRSADAAIEALSWFSDKNAPHIIEAQSIQAGQSIIVIKSPAHDISLLSELASKGEKLSPPKPKSKFSDPWVWRGISSTAGQSLTLTSSVLGRGPRDEQVSKFSFAGLNLLANGINIIFGKQEKNDPHQLRIVAQKINDAVVINGGKTADLPNAEAAPDITLPADSTPRSFGQKTYDFLSKYSVSGGEIGIRTLAAMSLTFPVTRAIKIYKNPQGIHNASQLFHALKNPNPVSFFAGLATVSGKFISMAAKESDPYNPTPPTLIESVRQKIMWPLSSLVEGVAAGFMTHNSFTKQTIKIKGREMPDYLGGIGNTVFVGGYGIRLAAPYGTHEVDMKKLYAHSAQALAQIAPEKLPDALSSSAQTLALHFNRPSHSFGILYTGLMDALEKFNTTAKPSKPSPAIPASDTPKPHIIADASLVSTPMHTEASQRIAL